MRLPSLREHEPQVHPAPTARAGGQTGRGRRPLLSPSDSTFQRVLNRLDASRVATIVGEWLAEQEVGALARLALDGKVLRGSGRHDGKPLQLLSAVTHHLRLTLDQIAIEQKSNEIPALKPLLRRVAVPAGTLVTGDAMHCQQESARFITQEWGGDYLFGLKGNQSGIEAKARHLLTQQGFPPSGPVGKGPRTD
ncbi:MAG: ISAs1 family transposase [Verrucomicrobia bacterium]|nr:ISAs1 family transposase [Verrucomicrobiota bacterium]